MNALETIEANRPIIAEIDQALRPEFQFSQYVNTFGYPMYRLLHVPSGMTCKSNESDHPREIAMRMRALFRYGQTRPGALFVVGSKALQPFMEPIS